MSLARMRTINEAHEYLLTLDKETCITKYLIREICKQGKVKCLRTGTRYLIDIDDLVLSIGKINEI